MILYHGSCVEVREPRLLECQRALDFGSGFYTTTDREQASRWAKRVAWRLKSGNALVNVYEVDEDAMGILKVLSFPAPDAKWLRFVAPNRRHQAVAGQWDIIHGPVADDQTSAVIDLFITGMYDEEEAARRLLPMRLSDQWTFKTQGALGILRFVEAVKA